MYRISLFLVVASILILFGSPRASAASGDASTIVLASGTLDIHDSAATALAPGDHQAGVFLVKYPGPVGADERAALERSVERVYTYLPHFTYLVRLAPGQADDLAAAWVGDYLPEYKISPQIRAVADTVRTAHLQQQEQTDEPAVVLLLHLFPDVDFAGAAQEIASLGFGHQVGKATGTRFARLRLVVTAADLARHLDSLARLDEIFWIDVEARRVLYNDTTIWVGQSGTDGGQQTPIFDHGLYGEGQIVAVLDTGIDPDLCYFQGPLDPLPPVNACDGGTIVDLDQRKILAVDFLDTGECASGVTATEWDTHDHGSHVAGTVAGDDPTTPLLHDPGDGMAPGARLVIQDGGFGIDNCADLPGLGCPVVDLQPIFQQAYDQGARLHTNSWGDQENNPMQNTYSAGSEDADAFMWDHKDFLLIFAAGNSGPGSGSVGSPSTAKNVISVGATRRGSQAESMASFSSCGPTADGRLKPDVTAPGFGIISANNDGNVNSNNCGTRSMSGTSMAAPAVAGLAALTRQYFVDGFYPSGTATAMDAFVPSAALVKAAIVNSTQAMTDVAQPIPSSCQGWGRVLLDSTLHFPAETRRLWVQDDPAGFPLGANGDARHFFFEITDPSEPLKVTLTWTDFPSVAAAGLNLVNDLDLIVDGPAGTFLGNVFSAGVSSAGGDADRRNNLEQVLLANPDPGTYQISVQAFNIADGPQPFALVVSGGMTAMVAEVFDDGFESGDLSAWSSSE